MNGVTGELSGEPTLPLIVDLGRDQRGRIFRSLRLNTNEEGTNLGEYIKIGYFKIKFYGKGSYNMEITTNKQTNKKLLLYKLYRSSGVYGERGFPSTSRQQGPYFYQ